MLSFFADNGKPILMLMAVCMAYLVKSLPVNLVDVVTATPYFRCSDPRDHLYSLLSLTRAGSTRLKADYTLSPEEVCTQFAVSTLVSDQNMRVLSLAPHTELAQVGGPPPGRPTLQVPSWVPDLTRQGALNPLVSYTIRPQIFRAGGPPGTEPGASLSADGKQLRLRGRIVDAVAEMARCQVDVPFPTDEEVRPRSGLPARAKKRMVNWIRECRSIAGEEHRAEGPEEDVAAGRAFLETLACGMTAMRDPLPEEVLVAMQVYVDYLSAYFVDGSTMSEDVWTTMLTYGVLCEQSLLSIAESRRFCRTAQGRFGQVRADARHGDVFACIAGAEVPYLLRPSPGREGLYRLIGDSFLSGVMQGEAWSDGRYSTVDIAIE